MPKSVLLLLCALALGSGLAILSIHTALPTGWIGGLALIGWTLAAKKHWAKTQKTTGLEPGEPERRLRFHAVGTALLFGHMITGFAFPEIDLHFNSGNFLAIDSWTMIIAMIIATVIARPIRKVQDERDAAITAQGNKAGFLALIAILIVFSFFLAILPPRYIPSLSYFVLGNMQIAIILASLLTKYTVQLYEYAKDTDAHFAMDIDE